MGEIDALEVTLSVTRVLESLKVRYVIGGSFASAIHGLVRTTMDVDIVADLRGEHVQSLVSSLQEAFYIDEGAVSRGIINRTIFNLIHLTTMFKVDIFLPQDRPFDEQQFARRKKQVMNPDSGESLWVLSAEDVILAKLDWFRMGGDVSEVQWRDIITVLKVKHPNLDHMYLEKWAIVLGVKDLLNRALEEIES
jgi:hypothetical protein